jgi:WD40 repeat protein
MNPADLSRFEDLLSRYLDAQLTHEQETELLHLLQDPARQRVFLQLTRIDREIADCLAVPISDDKMAALVDEDIAQAHAGRSSATSSAVAEEPSPRAGFPEHAGARRPARIASPESTPQGLTGSKQWIHGFASAGRSWRWRTTGVAATLLLALAMSLWVYQREPVAAPVLARLEQVQGEVYVLIPGGKVAAQSGQRLCADQGLQTVGEGSSAVVVYPDATRLEVGADTRIPELAGGDETGKWVFLAEGYLTAEVTKQPEGRPMVLATPHAEVLVLGTKLSLSNGAAATYLEIANGKVQLTRKSDGQSTEVTAGFDVVVTRGSEPLAPQPVPRFHTPQLTLHGFSAAHFSSDGRTLVTWRSNLSSVTLLDLATSQQRLTLSGHAQGVGVTVFSPDSKTLATGSADRTVKLWDLATGQLRASLGEYSGAISGLAFSSDGKTLAVMAGEDRAVTLWDLATGQQRGPSRTYPAKVAALCPQAQMLATASADGTTVTLWDLATGHPRAELPLGKEHKTLYSLAFSPDSKRLAVSGSGVLDVWDIQSGRVQVSLKVPAPKARVFCMAFAPDGTRLALGYSSIVQLWDLATAKQLAAFWGHTRPVNSVALAPDGKTLAAGGGTSEEATVKLWELPPAPEDR